MLYKFLGSVSVVEWKDEIVIYQTSSGDTHLLVGFAKSVFVFCLSKECFRLTEIVDYARTLYTAINDIERNIELVLENLVQKDLIFLEKL
jgi:hypothetical protein